jgi:hypothetical protein
MTATFSVTKAALIQRINRRLKADGRRIRKNRDGWMRLNFGVYCVFSNAQNRVFEHHVDIEELARQLGVMGGWERTAGDAAAA